MKEIIIELITIIPLLCKKLFFILFSYYLKFITTIYCIHMRGKL